MRGRLAWLVIVTLAGAVPVAAQGVHGRVANGQLKRLGVAGFGKAAPAPAATESIDELEIRNTPDEDRDFDKQISGNLSPARVPASHVPKPVSHPVVGGGPALGTDGLTHAEQRLAGSGAYANTQFSLEPPDQALAVGNGYIVEAVNTAIRVRDAATGAPLTPAVPLNQFLALAPAIDRATVTYGPFVTDPKAYFDPPTGRFFVTSLMLGVNPANGAFDGTSSVLIAVSQSGDPTGAYYLYAIDTQNGDGSLPNHPNCPCFGDQPLIGADASGFYVSTNEFPVFRRGFNGAQIYAMSKAALIAGMPATPVVFDGLPLAEGPAYSVQPATVPPGGAFAAGREYFMSALEFTGTLDNRIAIWELSGTASLGAATPSLTLTSAVVDSQVYGQPPGIEQRNGPLPLADFIASGALTGKRVTEHLPLVESNDDRMQQTVFAAGRLWSALNTVVQTENGPVTTGIAWFVVEPSGTGATLAGSVVNQGYVSVRRNSVAFPSIGVNASGRGVMAFTLVGPDYYPSAAYVTLDAAAGTGNIHIAAAGTAPEDGFSGYGVFGGRVARWGDYSAAVADENGDIWTAVEYIPDLPRTLLANWGTFIAKVTP